MTGEPTPPTHRTPEDLIALLVAVLEGLLAALLNTLILPTALRTRWQDNIGALISHLTTLPAPQPNPTQAANHPSAPQPRRHYYVCLDGTGPRLPIPTPPALPTWTTQSAPDITPRRHPPPHQPEKFKKSASTAANLHA